MPTTPAGKGFGRTLIAVQRSADDANLFGYAAMLTYAGIIRDLRFVHVLPDQGAADAPDHDSVAAELKAEVEKHFTVLPTGASMRYDLRRGPLTDRLLEYAAEQEVELILLGHCQRHPLRRSLARRLAMKAPCSVWLVPEGSPASLRRVLVPIDFSPRAADALGVALVLAHQVGLNEVTALHVYFDESRTTYEEAETVVRGKEAEAFRRFIAPVNTHGVTVMPVFREGVHPADTIINQATATGVDLIVMETRGRSRSAAILLGSVAEDTLVQSHVPVLVVKHFGARISVLQALLDRTFRRGSGVQFD